MIETLDKEELEEISALALVEAETMLMPADSAGLEADARTKHLRIKIVSPAPRVISVTEPIVQEAEMPRAMVSSD